MTDLHRLSTRRGMSQSNQELKRDDRSQLNSWLMQDGVMPVMLVVDLDTPKYLSNVGGTPLPLPIRRLTETELSLHH